MTESMHEPMPGSEDQRFPEILALRRSIRRLQCAITVLATGILLMLAGGAAFKEKDVDHDVVIRDHKLVIKDDDGNERIRISADKIELKDNDGTTRIRIAVEQTQRAGIHFYNRQGVKRLWLGSGDPPQELGLMTFFDPTGQAGVREISPFGMRPPQ